MIDEHDNKETVDIIDLLAEEMADDRQMSLSVAGEWLKQGILRLSELCRNAEIPVDEDTTMHMTRMVAALRYVSKRAAEENDA